VLTARRGQQPGAFAAAATRALPRDKSPAFTGRQAEFAQLMQTLAGARRRPAGWWASTPSYGMAGIGKTTFAVHAAHRLTGSFSGGQFFLPLHAHTGWPAAGWTRPMRWPACCWTAGVGAQHIPPGLEARAARWRDFAAGKKILLLLDDAAGHEQVGPLLPGTPGSLVLVTSRAPADPRLQDAAVISLDTLPPGEAATLLARLAARPRDNAPATLRCATSPRLCGYLPLAIGMLASQLRHHPARTGTGLAAELAQAPGPAGCHARREHVGLAPRSACPTPT